MISLIFVPSKSSSKTNQKTAVTEIVAVILVFTQNKIEDL